MAQLAVAVRGDAVASVPVVVESDPTKRDAVLLQRPPDVRQLGRGMGSSAPSQRDSLGSVDFCLYIQRRCCCQSMVSISTSRSVSAPCSQPRYVDPRLVVEPHPLERDGRVDRRVSGAEKQEV